MATGDPTFEARCWWCKEPFFGFSQVEAFGKASKHVDEVHDDEPREEPKPMTASDYIEPVNASKTAYCPGCGINVEGFFKDIHAQSCHAFRTWVVDRDEPLFPADAIERAMVETEWPGVWMCPECDDTFSSKESLEAHEKYTEHDVWAGRDSILTEANDLVHGDRQKVYGHPRDDFAATGRMWGSILTGALGMSIPDISPHTVALMMVALKVSRESRIPKRDNRVDMAGYAETADMVAEAEVQ